MDIVRELKKWIVEESGYLHVSEGSDNIFKIALVWFRSVVEVRSWASIPRFFKDHTWSSINDTNGDTTIVIPGLTTACNMMRKNLKVKRQSCQCCHLLEADSTNFCLRQSELLTRHRVSTWQRYSISAVATWTTTIWKHSSKSIESQNSTEMHLKQTRSTVRNL